MKKEKKGKRIIIIVLSILTVLVLLIVALGACMAKSISDSMMFLENNYITTTAEIQNLSTSISVSGTVEGNDEMQITTNITAKVSEVNVKVGDYIKKGDALCVLDSSDLQQSYDELKKSIGRADAINDNTHTINQRNLENAKVEKEAALNQAQRAITEAETARDNAYSKRDTLNAKCEEYAGKRDAALNSMNSAEDESLYEAYSLQYQQNLQLLQSTEAERDAISESLSNYDNAVVAANEAYHAAVRNADAMIQSAQDTLNIEALNEDDSAQKELKKLEEQIAACTIVAPQDGIITAVNITVGSIPLSENLMTITNNETLKITVNINEADILNVKEGMKTVIRTNATGDKEFIGKITKVVNILSPGSMGETGNYSAEVTINDNDTDLLIGMSAKARIIIEEKDNVLSVPYDAVTTDENDDKIVFLAVENEDGTSTAKAVKVKTGIEADYYTELTSGEIAEGDSIFAFPDILTDGQIVSTIGASK